MKKHLLIMSSILGMSASLDAARLPDGEHIFTEHLAIIATKMQYDRELLGKISDAFRIDANTLYGNSEFIRSYLTIMAQDDRDQFLSLEDAVNRKLDQEKSRTPGIPAAVARQPSSSGALSAPFTLGNSTADMAKVLASSSEYLEALFSITGSPEFIDKFGKSDELARILPSVTVENWMMFLESIIERQSNEAIKLKALISEQIAKERPSQSQPALSKPSDSGKLRGQNHTVSSRVDIQRLLADRPQYDIDGIKFALFNVAPLGDCGLLSLPGNISREQAVRLVQAEIHTPTRLHLDDVAYLKDQHHHLTTEGQSLESRHLKLIGFLLGYDVRFFSPPVEGMLIEDSEIKVLSKPRDPLHQAYVYDGMGHFQALIPVSDAEAVRDAYAKEEQGNKDTDAFKRKYQ
jgi:hypothetical protein